MKRPLLLLVILLLSACSSMKGAIPAQCNAMCFQPCVSKDGDTGVRWDAKEADPWRMGCPRRRCHKPTGNQAAHV